jgi:phytoene dehydrogenase-like protein
MRYFFASCGLHGALAPDDALGANFAWLYAAAVQDVGVSIVKGGMHNVSRALAAELADHGGEIRVNSGVKSIAVEKDRAVSVRLDNGEVIALDGMLASNVDPSHLALDLLAEAQIGESDCPQDQALRLGAVLLRHLPRARLTRALSRRG